MINYVFLIVFLALCVASLYGWQSIARRSGMGLPLIGQRTRFTSPLGLVDVGVMFLTWIAGQLIGVMWLQVTEKSWLDSAQGPELAMLIGIMAICQLGSTGLGLAIIYFRYRSLESLGLLWSNWQSEIKLGLLAFILVVPPLLVLQWSLTYFVDYSHASMDALKANPTLLSLSAVWCGAVISAPICEEVFFRGFLQPWLQKISDRRTPLETLIAGGWDSQPNRQVAAYPPMVQRSLTEPSIPLLNPQGPTTLENDNSDQAPGRLERLPNRARADVELSANSKLPIFLSSLVFATVHIGQGLAPIPLFFMGLVLGYLYLKTNSLLPCIVLHMGLNAFSMFWFTVSLFTSA